VIAAGRDPHLVIDHLVDEAMFICDPPRPVTLEAMLERLGLTDPLTRSLLHLGGTLHYQPDTITVTLDPPDTLRLTSALTALITELNHTPPRLLGDPRPITYKIQSQQ